MNDRLLTTREVASYLGFSPETVLRRYRAGSYRRTAPVNFASIFRSERRLITTRSSCGCWTRRKSLLDIMHGYIGGGSVFGTRRVYARAGNAPRRGTRICVVHGHERSAARGRSCGRLQRLKSVSTRRAESGRLGSACSAAAASCTSSIERSSDSSESRPSHRVAALPYFGEPSAAYRASKPSASRSDRNAISFAATSAPKMCRRSSARR